ncbi:Lrp/AsnC family transcriptional regulator, partial [Vibrio genomosp. F6]
MELDNVDKKILSMLQVDSTLSLNDLAEAVNLTT